MFIGKSPSENDVVLAGETSVSDRQCLIKYDAYSNQYFLKDIQETGTLIKVVQPVRLVAETYLRVGDSLIHSLVGADNSLSLVILDGPLTDHRFFFRPLDEPVTIGRLCHCSVSIEEDRSMSRFHCVISWRGGTWMLADGDGHQASSNGTWLLTRWRPPPVQKKTTESASLKNSASFSGQLTE